MDQDTWIGGEANRFPLTRRSVLAAVKGEDVAARERALQTLIEAYWKPVYKYIRLKWHAGNEEAKDFTQAFFASAMERAFFERHVEQRASFRTYLRLCVDGFVSNERKAARRLKRGGAERFVPLDFDAADAEFEKTGARGGGDPDGFFDHECSRSLFARALESFRAECESTGKPLPFQLFERYDLHADSAALRLTYDQLAAAFDVPVTQVANHLAWARRTFRRHVLEALRELTSDEAEFREEARRLLGMHF